MKFKKILYPLLSMSILTLSSTVSARLIYFSRANCINNESITWDWPNTNYWLRTESFHFKNGKQEPMINTGWQYGYRSAAVHWGEGTSGGFYVIGNHYWINPTTKKVEFLSRTTASGCNLDSFFPYWN